MPRPKFYITNVLIFFSVCAYLYNITPVIHTKTIGNFGKNETRLIAIY